MAPVRCGAVVTRYRRGYMGRDYHVTGGHEAEAKAAQRAESPSRLGLFVLRVLGFRGSLHGRRSRRPPSPRHQQARPPDAP